MKTIVALLLIVSACSAQDGTISTPKKMGQNVWRLDSSGGLFTFTQAYREKDDFNRDGIGASSEEPMVLLREELPKFQALLEKFAEWAATAKKNKVVDYRKDLGVLDSMSLTFAVDASYRCRLRVLSKKESILTETDAALLLSLVKRIPELKPGAPPKDPRDNLFK